MVRIIKEHKILDFNKISPEYQLHDKFFNNVFYHNTEYKNLDSIMENGLLCNKGKEMNRGKDGDFIWAVTTPNLKGYGGCTVAFKIPNKNDLNKYKVNDDQYTFPFDIPVNDILFIDVPISSIPNSRISDISELIEKFGKDKVINVLSNKLINDFTKDDLIKIINGN